MRQRKKSEPGASGCEKGFVKCFLRVPQAVVLCAAQASGNFRKHFTEPFSKPDATDCTLLGVQSWARFCQQEFGEFLRLVGRYCSYLLPKQAGGTPQILIFKTSPMTGRLRVYILVECSHGPHCVTITSSFSKPYLSCSTTDD